MITIPCPTFPYDVLLLPSSQPDDGLDSLDDDTLKHFNIEDFLDDNPQQNLLNVGFMATTASRKRRQEPDSLVSVVGMLNGGMAAVDENNILDEDVDMNMNSRMNMNIDSDPFDGGVEEDDVILHGFSLPRPTTVFAFDQHPGNNRLYILISLYRKRYMEAYEAGCERECHEVAEEVVDTIIGNCSGRFREWNPLSHTDDDWVEMSRNAAIDRVKWALRDPPQVKLSEFNYHGGEEYEEEVESYKDADEEQEAGMNIGTNTSTDMSENLNNANAGMGLNAGGTDIGTRSKFSSSAKNTYEGKGCKSNDLTNPTAFSQTVSFESRSYLESCVASEVTSMSVVSSAKVDLIDEVLSDNHNRAVFDNKTTEISAQRRPPTGMRRRGVISSTETENMMHKKEESNISEIPHERFNVDKDFMSLVVDIFANQSSSKSSFSNSTRQSPELTTSEYNKRIKFSSNESVASTATSSLGGLRNDFNVSMNLNHDLHHQHRKAARERESSRAAAKKQSHRRKKARDRKREIAAAAAAAMDVTEVKEVKVSQVDGTTRNLSQFDVLCKVEPRLGIMTCNHVGNNRLRLILRINQERFNRPETTLAEKNRTIFNITQQILHSKKFKSFFLYQDRSNGNIWTEMRPERVPIMIKAFLEACVGNPSLTALPSYRETPWMTSLAHMQIMGIDDLHHHALRNIKRRRNKKAIPPRDPKKVQELQKTVLNKVIEN